MSVALRSARRFADALDAGLAVGHYLAFVGKSSKAARAAALVLALKAALVAALVLALAVATAWGLPRALRVKAERACFGGDDAACEVACSRGSAGERGCLKVARRLRERWLEEGRDPQLFERAIQYAERACWLRAPQGCNEALHYAPATDVRRFNWERRGCALGDEDNCLAAANHALARHPARVADAAARMCEFMRPLPAAREKCLAEWRARAEHVATAQKACTQRERSACSRLGAALLPHDPTAALEAYAAECTLRGLAGFFRPYTFECADGLEWYRGPSPATDAEACGFALMERDELARPNLASGRASAVPPSEPALGSFDLLETATLKLTLEPEDAELRRSLEAQTAGVARCLNPRAASRGLLDSDVERWRALHALGKRRLWIKFLVDRFGEIWLRSDGGDLSSAERACIVALGPSVPVTTTAAHRISFDYTFSAK